MLVNSSRKQCIQKIDASFLLFVFCRGNTDICDILGNTPMHHASANGHMNCTTFLVSFGANIWCLDNEFHTALDVAGLYGRNEIVKYLDSVVAKQSALNKKIVRKLKEKAVLDAQKRIKKYHKLQDKAQKKAEKEDRQLETASIKSQSRSAPASLHNYTYRSDGLSRYSVSLKSNFSEPKPFSAHFTNTTLSSGNKKFTLAGVAKKIKHRKDISNAGFSSEFKVGEVEMDGTRTIRSLSGLKRDHHVLYVKDRKGSDDSGSSKNDDIQDDVFINRDHDAVSRAISEPDFLYNGDSGVGSDDSTPPESSGIFERPGFGSVAFMNRRLANGTFMSLPSEGDDQEFEVNDKPATSGQKKSKHTRTHSSSDSIGTLGSLAARMRDLPWEEDDLETLDDDAVYDSSPLELFLAANGLTGFIPMFTREKIDLQAIMLLTDKDMVDLSLPMGPRRKLLAAVAKRKAVLDKPGAMEDSVL